MIRKTCVLLMLSLCPSPAALVRIDVEKTDTLNDRSFGPAGKYERITGKAHFAVVPTLAANRNIRDLDKAPADRDGRVEFDADVIIARPRDPARANGALLFDVSNRGSKGNMGFFNRPPADGHAASEFGDGFLLDQGYTLVWMGWQFDVPAQPGLLRLYTPMASGVTGLVRSEITVKTKEIVHTLADRDHIPYPVLNPADPALKLTVRDRADGARQVIPRSKWQILNGTMVELPEGFLPGKLYELVYTSINPPVAGLGFAAIRDLVAHLKYEVKTKPVDRAYAFGQSQTGRALRAFLYDGFNCDEAGRKVFDGILAHVAGAGRGSFNLRFAQPSRDGAPFFNVFYPTDIFPFTDLEETDPETNRTDGLFTHAMPESPRPKVFYTDSAYEYYGRAASLIHTTPDGRQDMPIPPNTRIYFFSSGQHGPAAFPPSIADTQYLPNPNPFPWCLRALLVAMDKWVHEGIEPPPSQYPRIDRGELTAVSSLAFPAIPGIKRPVHLQTGYRVNYGPEFESRGIISVEPPVVGHPFPVLVPQVDGDGNDIAGIRMPSISVPLGTYMGWNFRSESIGAPDEIAHLIGSYIPFPRTREERKKTGDPRLSVKERYASRGQYLEKIQAAAEDLVARRYLLERDVPRLIERAEAEWDYVIDKR